MTRFAGSLRDIPMADVLQTVSISPTGGSVVLETDFGAGTIWLAGNQIVDAELGPHAGQAALDRLLMAADGTFHVSFETPQRDSVVGVPPHVAMSCGERLDHVFRSMVPNSEPLWVCYQTFPPMDSGAQRELSRVLLPILERLAAEGMVAFTLPEKWLHERDWARLTNASPWGFVIPGRELSDDPLVNEEVNTVTVLPPLPSRCTSW